MYSLLQLLSIAAIALCSFSALAQDELMPPTTDGAADGTAEVSLEEQIAALQEQSAAMEGRVANAAEGVTEERAAQLGVTTAELDERVQLLRAMRTELTRHTEVLQDLVNTQEAMATAAKELAQFDGLPEAPPYSITYVDGHRNEVDTRQLNYEAAVAEQRLFAVSTQESENQVRTLQARLNQAREAAAKTPGATPGDTNWAIQLLQIRVEKAEIELASRKAATQLAGARTDVRRMRLELAQRKAEVALNNLDRRHSSLDDEFDMIFAEIETRRERYLETSSTAEKELEDARGAVGSARERLDAAVAETAAAESEEARAELGAKQAAAELELEAAQSRVDTAQAKREFAQRAQRVLEAESRIWMQRRDLYDTGTAIDLDDALTVSRNMDSLVEQWRRNYDANVAAVRSELASFAAAEAAHQGDPAQLERIRSALSEREAIYSEAALQLVNLGHLVDRLIEDIQRLRTSRSFFERWEAMSNSFMALWNYEVLSFDNSSITVRKIVMALVVFIVGILLSRLLTRTAIRRFFRRFSWHESVEATIERLFFYFMVVCVILFTLKTVSIPLTVFTLFGGALAIGVGFGAQNLINNFLSGLILLAERPIGIGDIVEIEGEMGIVDDIGARATAIKLFSGKDMLIPNSKFLENKVINWTHSDCQLRLELTVGVAYGSPTREVSKLIMKAAEEHALVLKRPEPVVIFEDFGDNALMFRLYFFIALDGRADGRVVGSDMRHRIDRLLKDAGIVISFPQRDLHVDSVKPLQIQLVDGNGRPAGGDESPLP